MVSMSREASRHENAEGLALTVELERRLRQGVDHLGEIRQSMEDLVRIADAIGPMLGVKQRKGRGKAAQSPATRMASGSKPESRTASASPTTKEARGSQERAPVPPAELDEIPEWRKMFPNLSAEVPGRGSDKKKQS